MAVAIADAVPEYEGMQAQYTPTVAKLEDLVNGSTVVAYSNNSWWKEVRDLEPGIALPTITRKAVMCAAGPKDENYKDCFKGIHFAGSHVYGCDGSVLCRYTIEGTPFTSSTFLGRAFTGNEKWFKVSEDTIVSKSGIYLGAMSDPYVHVEDGIPPYHYIDPIKIPVKPLWDMLERFIQAVPHKGMYPVIAFRTVAGRLEADAELKEYIHNDCVDMPLSTSYNTVLIDGFSLEVNCAFHLKKMYKLFSGFLTDGLEYVDMYHVAPFPDTFSKTPTVFTQDSGNLGMLVPLRNLYTCEA